MPSAVNKEMPIPLYYQIESYIQEQIRTGGLLPEEKLPTEQWYCSFFGVSRMTVRRALQELISSGVLARRRGQGPIVAPAHLSAHTRLTGLYDAFAARGVHLTTQVLFLGKEAVRPGEAGPLDVDSGTPLLSLRRLRSAEGSPVALQHSYLRGESCGGPLRASELKDSSLYALLEGRGVHVDHATQRFSSRPASEEQAELLGMEAAAPLIYAERVSYLANGEILEFSQSWFSPIGFDVTVELHR